MLKILFSYTLLDLTGIFYIIHPFENQIKNFLNQIIKYDTNKKLNKIDNYSLKMNVRI